MVDIVRMPDQRSQQGWVIISGANKKPEKSWKRSVQRNTQDELSLIVQRNFDSKWFCGSTGRKETHQKPQG